MHDKDECNDLRYLCQIRCARVFVQDRLLRSSLWQSRIRPILQNRLVQESRGTLLLRSPMLHPTQLLENGRKGLMDSLRYPHFSQHHFDVSKALLIDAGG